MSLDLRAVVRERIAVLGITRADAARLVAPRWGCSVDSAASRLTRWLATGEAHRDMTTDALAHLLDVLGLTVVPS